MSRSSLWRNVIIPSFPPFWQAWLMSNFSPQTQCLGSRSSCSVSLWRLRFAACWDRIPILSEEGSSTSLIRHILRWICFGGFQRSSFLLEVYLVLHVVFVAVNTESGASSCPLFVLIEEEVLQVESDVAWMSHLRWSNLFGVFSGLHFAIISERLLRRFSSG